MFRIGVSRQAWRTLVGCHLSNTRRSQAGPTDAEPRGVGLMSGAAWWQTRVDPAECLDIGEAVRRCGAAMRCGDPTGSGGVSCGDLVVATTCSRSDPMGGSARVGGLGDISMGGAAHAVGGGSAELQVWSAPFILWGRRGRHRGRRSCP